jgi:hypothetical protein
LRQAGVARAAARVAQPTVIVFGRSKKILGSSRITTDWLKFSRIEEKLKVES